MVLERKVASYGVLKLASKPDGRWTATFVRAGKWFSAAKQESIERSALAEAITAGMALVVGLVSEACSYRDTHRRNAVDADYAALHPPRPAAEPRDPTERYQGRSSFRAVEAADGWVVVNDVGAVVAKFGKREKGKASKHASALTRGRAPEASASAEVASGFGLTGMPGLAVVPTLADIPAPESPSCPTSVANIAASTEKEAQALEGYADSLWGTTEVPELLTRAAKLLRHAEALVKSPLCTGKEKQMAWEDLRRGAEAYTQARDAFVRGEKPDIVTTLRRIAERVSLAAARAAKSCGAGQQKIGKAPRSADDIAQGITRRGRPEADARRTSAEPPGRQGPEFAAPAPGAGAQSAGVRGSPPVLMPTVPMQPAWPPAAPPMAVPTTEKPKRTRKAKGAEVDPAKDKLLVDAFADAIKQAAAQMGGGA
jgi:hypothetical protein